MPIFSFLQHINKVLSRFSVLSVLFLIFSSIFYSFSVFFVFACLREIYFCHLLTVTGRAQPFLPSFGFFSLLKRIAATEAGDLTDPVKKILTILFPFWRFLSLLLRHSFPIIIVSKNNSKESTCFTL